MGIKIPLGSPIPQEPLPVARPVWGWDRVATDPDVEPIDEPGVSPKAVKSWSWSLAMHALVLVLLALWVFGPPVARPPAFDTTIGNQGGGGSGGDFGTLTGLEGLDEPLVLPDSIPIAANSALTSLPSEELTLAPDVLKAAVHIPDGGGGGSGGPGTGGGGGIGDGFGPGLFGQGTEKIGGVGVKVGDPQFTLIWDSKADIDLHVIEPGGSEIYWENTRGRRGGELDVDDIDGLGPENVYWVQGLGPPGEYRWYVFYFGGFNGVYTPTQWRVRVKHNGETKVYKGILRGIGDRSRLYTLDVKHGPEDTIPKDSEGFPLQDLPAMKPDK